MLVTQSAKITGIPDASGWSQVHEFKPEDPEKINLRGTLFAVISTKRIDHGGIDAISIGRELIARLHEEYYGDLTEKPFNALKNALEKVTTEFRESWGDVEIAACAFVDNVVYSAVSGGSEVTICRAGSLGTILKSQDTSVITASGYPKEGDMLLLATRKFYEKTSQGIIKAALTSPTPEDVIEAFGPGMHEDDGKGLVAAIIIQFNEEDQKQIFTTQDNPLNTSTITHKLSRNFFTDLTKKIENVVQKVGKNIPEKGIYLRTEVADETSSQSKKLTFSVALILLVILSVSIVFGVRQKKINDLKSKYESILVEAQSDVDQAISLASVSPDKSRELFVDSEQKLAEIEALNVHDSKVDALKNKIAESRGAILGEYAIKPDLFLDLSLLSSGFKGDSLSFSSGSIYILDKNGKRIVSVEISTKKSKVVAGPTTIDSVYDMASYTNRVFILSGDGIYELSNGKNKVIDKTWGGDAFIRAFAGNIYVLDKSGNLIYRYAGNGNSFGDQQVWLAKSTNADFSGAIQWVIDGSVYVLYPNSKILKYSLGSPQNFRISGVVPDIGSIDAVFAGEDAQNIYLLDRAGKRVVVVDKTGKYLAQYIDDQISSATNLVVSEADKKIILLTGDKLYSIDLQN